MPFVHAAPQERNTATAHPPLVSERTTRLHETRPFREGASPSETIGAPEQPTAEIAGQSMMLSLSVAATS